MYFLLPTQFQWPHANLPGTVSQYFAVTQKPRVSRKMVNRIAYFRLSVCRKQEVCNSRATLRFALQCDTEFLSFWNAYLERNPDKTDYLASLLNEPESFDIKKLKSEYFK